MPYRLEDDGESIVKPCDCGSPTCNSLECINPKKHFHITDNQSIVKVKESEENHEDDLQYDQINSEDFHSAAETVPKLEPIFKNVSDTNWNWKKECLCSLKDSKDQLLQKYIDHFNDHIHYTKYLQKLVKDGDVKFKNVGTNMCISKHCKNASLSTKKRTLAIARRIDQTPINFLKKSACSCLKMTETKSKVDTSEFLIIKCPITNDNSTSYPTFSCVKKYCKRSSQLSTTNSLNSVVCRRADDYQNRNGSRCSYDSFNQFFPSDEADSRSRTIAIKDNVCRPKQCKQRIKSNLGGITTVGTQICKNRMDNQQQQYPCVAAIATQASKIHCCSCACETIENYNSPKSTSNKAIECKCESSSCTRKRPKSQKRLLCIRVIGPHYPSHILYKRSKPTNSKILNDKSRGLAEYYCKGGKPATFKPPGFISVVHDKIDQLRPCASAECMSVKLDPKSCSKNLSSKNTSSFKPKFAHYNNVCPCSNQEKDHCCDSFATPQCKHTSRNIPENCCMPKPSNENQEKDRYIYGNVMPQCKQKSSSKQETCMPKSCKKKIEKENSSESHFVQRPSNKKTQSCQIQTHKTSTDQSTDLCCCIDNDDMYSCCNDDLSNVELPCSPNLQQYFDPKYFSCCPCGNMCNNMCMNNCLNKYPFETPNNFPCKNKTQCGEDSFTGSSPKTQYPFNKKCCGPRHCMDVYHPFKSLNPDSAVQVNSVELITQASVKLYYQSGPLEDNDNKSCSPMNQSDTARSQTRNTPLSENIREDSTRTAPLKDMDSTVQPNIISSADTPTVMLRYVASGMPPKTVGTHNNNTGRQNQSPGRESKRVSMRYEFPVFEKSVSPTGKEKAPSMEVDPGELATSADSMEERIKNLRQNLEKQNEGSENSSQKIPLSYNKDRAMSIISEEVEIISQSGIQHNNKLSKTLKVGAKR